MIIGYKAVCPRCGLVTGGAIAQGGRLAEMVGQFIESGRIIFPIMPNEIVAISQPCNCLAAQAGERRDED